MSEDSSEARLFRTSRAATVLGVAALGLGLAGYWQGMNYRADVRRPNLHRVAEATGNHSAAPRYTEIVAKNIGPNRDWKSRFTSLKQSTPQLFDPVVRTPEMKHAALVDRLRTRAFDGAPPAIPHPIEQQSAASCLVCHAQGVQLGDKIAAKMSHAHFSSCTQCHVETVNGSPIASADATASETSNDFVGVVRSGPGSRAMPGAPPMIPHTLHLRNDCLSCHGLVARPGLRTTHPWLQNCVQCHAATEPTFPLLDSDHLAAISGNTP